METTTAEETVRFDACRRQEACEEDEKMRKTVGVKMMGRDIDIDIEPSRTSKTK